MERLNSTILDYYIRKAKRLEKRGAHFDAKDMREDAGVGFAYGIAKSMGIDTEGMSPAEVFAAIKKEGGAGAAKKSGAVKGAQGGGGRKAIKVKGMSPKEVSAFNGKTKTMSKEYYDKATKVTQEHENRSLLTFTSHGEDHIRQVVEKTNQAADAIEMLHGNNKIYGGSVDRKLLLAAAQFHDTGMDGGNFRKYETKPKDNGEMKVAGDWLRDDHGLNSAIHILERAKDFEKIGVNPEQCAMLAFAHTKSKSGVQDLTNPEHWEAALQKTEAAVKEYNSVHPDNKISFDRNKIFEGGKPTAENIGMMASATAALRLGDANREANIPLKSQAGGEYKIDKMPKGDFKNHKEEAAAAVISITDKDGRHVLEKDDPKLGDVPGFEFSKHVVLGERNMVNVDTRYSKKHNTLVENVALRNGNEVPWSTTEALIERLGELNTINGVPRAMQIHMSGVKNKGKMSGSAAKAYKKMWETVQEKTPGIADIVLVFDDGSDYSFKKNSNKQ